MLEFISENSGEVSDMNDTNVSYFLSLARTKDLALTAEKFYSTPQSVLRNIRKIESELQVQLFHEDTSSIHLTHAGEEFLRLFSSLEQDLTAAKYSFSNDRSGSRLCVGWCDWSGCPDWITDAIKEYALLHPEIEIDARLTTSRNLISMIDDGSVDVAIASRFLTRGLEHFFDCTPLCELPLYLLVDKDSLFTSFDLSSPQTMAIPFFTVPVWEADDDMVIQRVNDELMRLGRRPKLVVVLPNWSSAYTEVHFGNGIAVSPKCKPLSDLDFFLFKPLERSTTLCAIHSQGNKNPAAAPFLEFLRRRPEVTL